MTGSKETVAATDTAIRRLAYRGRGILTARAAASIGIPPKRSSAPANAAPSAQPATAASTPSSRRSSSQPATELQAGGKPRLNLPRNSTLSPGEGLVQETA